MRRMILAALLLASPVLADEASDRPMSAEEFDARTQGRTITYSSYGQPYGIEQYLPGRKVVWAFSEGECKVGDWFQDGEFICFDYHDETALQCWTFFDGPGGLVARFRGDPVSEPLVSLQESTVPLNCEVPYLGT